MKAISVRQPWAQCISVGAKTVENRGRRTSHRGLIAIHASKTPDIDADKDPRVLQLLGPDPRVGAPVGAVVAVADLIDCHTRAPYGHQPDTCCEPWGERWYASASGAIRASHLVLANIRSLNRPVHCAGKVTVPWTLPHDIAALVEEQLADVCELCHEGQAVGTWKKLRVCQSCAEHGAYDDSLTPEERRAEHEAMARYVDETANHA